VTEGTFGTLTLTYDGDDQQEVDIIRREPGCRWTDLLNSYSPSDLEARIEEALDSLKE
jgi:hypothetical protein